MVQRFLNLIFCFSLILLVTFSVIAQEKKATDLDELKDAHINFKNKDYSKAYGYFQKMYEQYPKDPTYNYYTGVCLLFLEKNPEKGLKRLRLAATNDVPDDVYFYLGLAYHNSYFFDDALKNYNWFEKKASKNKAKEYDLQNHINKTINAKSLTSSIVIPVVISKINIKRDSFHEQYIIPELEGKFGHRNRLIKSQIDSTTGFSAMYMPNNPERNEVIYYSMRNDKRGDLDIYKSTRKADGTWSEPENVGDIINTPFDDNFPYLHSDGSSLYFASKGHYSMGGYDIYRTVWSWEKKQWSKPENLGFPINSTSDDFFFVPSPDEKYAFLSSSRDCTVEELNVYRIKYINDNPQIEQISYNELIIASKLEINLVDKNDQKAEKNNKPKNDQGEFIKLETKDSFLFKSEYDSILNEAMKYQLRADSLKWVIDSKRSQFGDSQTEEQKKKLSNELIQLESSIYSMQKIADQLYERVREIEQLNLANKTSSYEVKQEKSNLESIPKNKNNTLVAKTNINDSISFRQIEQINNNDNEVVNENPEVSFYIKTPSVYTAKKPIPTNEKLPKGIVYMIQLGAFNSVKSPDSFHGFTPISCITKQGSNLRKYYTGKFLQLKDAEKVLPKIKAKGYKDAYIVAFNNGKVIPINDATKLETKQPPGNASENLTSNSTNQIDPDELLIQFTLKFELTNQDTVLLDKIKIQISDKAKINKELKGNILFISIEWFVSFEETYAIKKKLEPIVNKEIEIHAFFGEIKIPVDQARKMTH